MYTEESDSDERRILEYDTIVATAGTIAPWKIAAILAMGATVEDLDKAVAWVSVEEGGDLHHSASARPDQDHKAAGIYDILTSDRPDSDD